LSFWRDRSTFVTGATGLVGGALVRQLTAIGADVVCLVRDWVPQSELVRSGLLASIKIVRGDIRDQALLERSLGEYEVETVFHLAAQTTVPVANRSPVSSFETNVGGTWSLLEACRRSPRVKQIVVASSDKAYGETTTLPYTEETPLAGRHPYDASKACADLISQSYAATFGTPLAIARCGNFYGPGDLNWNRLVPGTIRSILKNEPPLIRSDGQYVRDYFYVDDGAAAYVLLAETLAERPGLSGQAFNFSNETALSVMKLVEEILRLMKSPLVPEIRNDASHEIRRQCLSAAKARAQLGWRPLFRLEDGLRHTIAWYEGLLGRSK
jgi:CDP-glucose 4,6-dehydratase